MIQMIVNKFVGWLPESIFCISFFLPESIECVLVLLEDCFNLLLLFVPLLLSFSEFLKLFLSSLLLAKDSRGGFFNFIILDLKFANSFFDFVEFFLCFLLFLVI